MRFSPSSPSFKCLNYGVEINVVNVFGAGIVVIFMLDELMNCVYSRTIE